VSKSHLKRLELSAPKSVQIRVSPRQDAQVIKSKDKRISWDYSGPEACGSARYNCIFVLLCYIRPIRWTIVALCTDITATIWVAIYYYFFITPDKGSTQRTQPAKNTKHQYKYKKKNLETPLYLLAVEQQPSRTDRQSSTRRSMTRVGDLSIVAIISTTAAVVLTTDSTANTSDTQLQH